MLLFSRNKTTLLWRGFLIVLILMSVQWPQAGDLVLEQLAIWCLLQMVSPPALEK